MNYLYRFIRFMVWLFYPKCKVEGAQNLPDEPAILVGNHCQANGPIISQLYMPRESYAWCIGEMMHTKEVPAYAYKDFWSKKPSYIRWLFWIISYLIAPIAAFVMSHANTIGVYKDKRIMKTFTESVEKLKNGADVVIFPECYDAYNNIVNDFQPGFLNVARMYYKKTKKSVSFVPMYLCPALRKVVIGKPIYFNTEEDPHKEEERIRIDLMEAISEIAYELPRHKVVTYANVSKKLFPYNDRHED